MDDVDTIITNCPLYNTSVQITTTQASYGKALLMASLRWFGWFYGLISLVTGVSLGSGAAFLLHQSLGTSLWIGTAGFIVATFEGSWRLACKEKDALDPEWRTKYGRKIPPQGG
jgi:hypothetical protein